MPVAYTHIHTAHTHIQAYRELPSCVKNVAWELVADSVRTHTYTHKCSDKKKKKTPPVPCSMPEQAAPDAAVVFSADNLLPQMPALCYQGKNCRIRALFVTASIPKKTPTETSM